MESTLPKSKPTLSIFLEELNPLLRTAVLVRIFKIPKIKAHTYMGSILKSGPTLGAIPNIDPALIFFCEELKCFRIFLFFFF